MEAAESDCERKEGSHASSVPWNGEGRRLRRPSPRLHVLPRLSAAPINCASRSPLAFSWLTTSQPSAGESACSAAFTVSGSVAAPFGATQSNMPLLTAGVNGLNFAVMSAVSDVLSVSPKPSPSR